MKIEKVSENQIRCTLTKEDLLNREIKLSELAYGTEKAKNLFRDMMEKASSELGFEAEDIPLMIEAIPLNSECIVLIITKVDDPEELDTRFSRFAPSVIEESEELSLEDADSAPEDMHDLFKKIQSVRKNVVSSDGDKSKKKGRAAKGSAEENFTRVFTFGDLNSAVSGAKVIAPYFEGISRVYKNPSSGNYMLVLTQGDGSCDSFDRISNMISEYGTLDNSLSKSAEFFAEHYEPLIKENAINKLSSL